MANKTTNNIEILPRLLKDRINDKIYIIKKENFKVKWNKEIGYECINCKYTNIHKCRIIKHIKIKHIQTNETKNEDDLTPRQKFATYIQIDHHNEIKDCNIITNLFWMTPKKHAHKSRKQKRKDQRDQRGRKSIIGWKKNEPDNKRYFDDVKKAASELGLTCDSIRRVISGKTKVACKFEIWSFQYITLEKKENNPIKGFIIDNPNNIFKFDNIKKAALKLGLKKGQIYDVVNKNRKQKITRRILEKWIFKIFKDNIPNLPGEIWRKLKDYKQYFPEDNKFGNTDVEISNMGRVYNNRGKHYGGLHRGYYVVSVNNKLYRIHRLVAASFLGAQIDAKGISFSKLNVYHVNKNEKTNNNKVENLQLLTQNEYNKKTINRKGRKSKTSREIIAISIKDNSRKEFSSITEAAKSIGSSTGDICRVLKGRRKTSKGYTFEYVPRSSDSDIKEEIWCDLKDNIWVKGDFGNAQVSNMGRIKSKKGIKSYGSNENGYMRVRIGRKRYLVHRLVAVVFKSKLLEEMYKKYENID